MNETQNQTELYPFTMLLKAVEGFLKKKRIAFVHLISNEKGDIEFSIHTKDLGIEYGREFIADPFHRTETFWNLIGEMLVRSQIDQFFDLVMGKNYEKMVEGYVHRSFGMQRNRAKNLVIFHFHASLIYSIFNEQLRFDLQGNADDAVCKQQRLDCKEVPISVVSSASSSNIRIKIPRSNGSRRNWEGAFNAILGYYGVGKRVSLSKNESHYLMDVDDEK